MRSQKRAYLSFQKSAWEPLGPVQLQLLWITERTCFAQEDREWRILLLPGSWNDQERESPLEPSPWKCLIMSKREGQEWPPCLGDYVEDREENPSWALLTSPGLCWALCFSQWTYITQLQGTEKCGYSYVGKLCSLACILKNWWVVAIRRKRITKGMD